MRFPHEDEEWDGLLEIVAGKRDLQAALIEKDYWVTHTLWALETQGFALWFKGGTSLSKGFGLIERFSEDLDLRLDAGTAPGLVDPALPWEDPNNRGRRARGIAERDRWFDTLAARIEIAGCSILRDPTGSDRQMRSACLQVQYPIRHSNTLPLSMRPFVLLELGRARVLPSVQRAMSSWVHDHLAEIGATRDFIDNRPRAIACVHPWVTCIEKLEAIARRFDRGQDADQFVRHYEDAARIVERRMGLPALPGPDADLRSLARRISREDGKSAPPPTHPAFRPTGSECWRAIADAWEAIGPMYWGPRLPIDRATETLRRFLGELAAEPDRRDAAP